MIITDIEVKDALYELIKGSDLREAVTGGLYKDKRPQNSTKEDIVISVIGRYSGDVQNLTVVVNVYVPDIQRGNEFVENTPRLRALSVLSANLFSELVFDRFRVDFDYQSVTQVNTIDFHTITNRLNVQVFTVGLRTD